MISKDLPVNSIAKSKVVIRKATAADAAVLASLRYEFRGSLGPTCESKEAFVARCRLWMQTRLEASVTWHCWLIEIEQMPVGHVWLELIEKIPNPAIEADSMHTSQTFMFGKIRVVPVSGQCC